MILNVRLLGEDACLLGIEMHVCEVQLLLEPLLDLQVLSSSCALFLIFSAVRWFENTFGVNRCYAPWSPFPSFPSPHSPFVSGQRDTLMGVAGGTGSGLWHNAAGEQS